MSDLLQEFFSKLALLIIGSLAAQYIVQRYQKKKDVRETRESVLALSLEVSRKLTVVLKYWNEWVYALALEEITNEETHSEEINNHENDFEVIKIQNMIEEAFVEFRFALTLLIGRLDVSFKLPSNAVELILKLEEKIKTFAEILETAVETEERTKEVRKEGSILAKYLNALLPIILRAQPK